MSELVGRFLSFEESLGKDLVKFVYYVLLFLLVVTTLYDLVTSFVAIFTVKILPNLGQVFVVIPLRFFVTLLLLRVASEVVIAVLSIDDNLRAAGPDGDTMSSGLNPVVRPAEPAKPVAKKAAKKKAAKKAASKKSAKMAADSAPDTSPSEDAQPEAEPADPKEQGPADPKSES